MAEDKVVIKAKRCKYEDGIFVAIGSCFESVIEFPSHKRAIVHLGTPYKSFCIYGGAEGEYVEKFPGDMYGLLTGNSYYYQDAGRIKKWMISAFVEDKYPVWRGEISGSLMQVLGKHLQWDNPRSFPNPFEMGTINVLGTNYAVSIDALSSGPMHACMIDGRVVKIQKGDAKSPIEIEGLEFKFNLEFERKPRPAK